MVADQEKMTGSNDPEWLDRLVRDLEANLEQGRVVVLERKYFDEEPLVSKAPFYDLVVIAPVFQDREYEDRINMIWPLFAKLPDQAFKKILSVDCVTPAEYTRRVA